MKLTIFIFTILLSAQAQGKVFKNSYLSFELPDSWNCTQEGVAWTCTPLAATQAKEAVIVLASKVAGPEDNLANFKTFLAQPKRIPTKVGTPMPSRVIYAQERVLDNTRWIQAQHLGSEIQEYYTLYLATVKDQLAILVSFTADRNHYEAYNPVFDKAMKTLKIIANQELLFAKKGNGGGNGDSFAIQPAPAPTAMNPADLMPPPENTKGRGFDLTGGLVLLLVIAVAAAVSVLMLRRNKKNSPPKTRR